MLLVNTLQKADKGFLKLVTKMGRPNVRPMVRVERQPSVFSSLPSWPQIRKKEDAEGTTSEEGSLAKGENDALRDAARSFRRDARRGDASLTFRSF